MTAATRSPAAASPRASPLAASPVPQRETPLSALPLTPRAATYSPRAVAAGARYARPLRVLITSHWLLAFFLLAT